MRRAKVLNAESLKLWAHTDTLQGLRCQHYGERLGSVCLYMCLWLTVTEITSVSMSLKSNSSKLQVYSYFWTFGTSIPGKRSLHDSWCHFQYCIAIVNVSWSCFKNVWMSQPLTFIKKFRFLLRINAQLFIQQPASQIRSLNFLLFWYQLQLIVCVLLCKYDWILHKFNLLTGNKLCLWIKEVMLGH